MSDHADHTVQIRAAPSSSFIQRWPSSMVKAEQQMRGIFSPLQSGSVQRILHTLTALHARWHVLLCTANIHDPAVPGQHPLGQFPGCSAIIVYTQATSWKRCPVTTTGTRQFLNACAS